MMKCKLHLALYRYQCVHVYSNITLLTEADTPFHHDETLIFDVFVLQSNAVRCLESWSVTNSVNGIFTCLLSATKLTTIRIGKF